MCVAFSSLVQLPGQVNDAAEDQSKQSKPGPSYRTHTHTHTNLVKLIKIVASGAHENHESPGVGASGASLTREASERTM